MSTPRSKLLDNAGRVAAQVELAARDGWLKHFRAAGLAHDVRASLLLAIASRETWIGRTALLENWAGDGGHGRGLMQIDDRWHAEFTSSHANDDHAANVEYAAQLLAQLKEQLPSERAAIAAYNAGPGNVRKALRRGLDVDTYTTGGDYSADVLRREDAVKSELNALGYAPSTAVSVPGPLAAVAPLVDAAARSPLPLGLGSAAFVGFVLFVSSS